MMRRLLSLLTLAMAALLMQASAWAETQWSVVATYPHDSRAFTQGLLYLDGHLYESTGQYGRSQIRKLRLKDGKVLQSTPVPSAYFGEGMTNWGHELLSLSWRNGTGFRWDRASFKQTGTFSYTGEGWGLAQDGKSLILSDGSSRIRFLDPVSFAETRRIEVTWQGQPVQLLNELEYVHGEILANVWMTDFIVRINPRTGAVIDLIDLTSLARQNLSNDSDAVLNGIAYDSAKDRLFVTGKNWPRLYEIKLDYGGGQ